MGYRSAYGYARISTTAQDHSIQIEAFRKLGGDVICEVKRSGTTREGRTELAQLLELIR